MIVEIENFAGHQGLAPC